MRNLDQLRAAAALKPATTLKRGAVSKLPGLILNNGLLSAAAFADDDGGGENRGHIRTAMIATIEHLTTQKLVAAGTRDIRSFIHDLSSRDSLALQRATTEALAYLAYLKRFANPD